MTRSKELQSSREQDFSPSMATQALWGPGGKIHEPTPAGPALLQQKQLHLEFYCSQPFSKPKLPITTLTINRTVPVLLGTYLCAKRFLPSEHQVTPCGSSSFLTLCSLFPCTVYVQCMCRNYYLDRLLSPTWFSAMQHWATIQLLSSIWCLPLMSWYLCAVHSLHTCWQQPCHQHG